MSGTVTQIDIDRVEVSNNESTWYPLQYCDIATTGICTSADASWNKTVTVDTDDTWVWRIDVAAAKSVRAIFDEGAGTPNADDEITVTHRFCVN